MSRAAPSPALSLPHEVGEGRGGGAATTTWALVAIVALVLLLAGTGAAIAESPRVRAWWLARSLDAKDPAERERTRAALVALGRPVIERYLPAIVAGELADHASPDSIFVVGRRLGTTIVSERGHTVQLDARDIFAQSLPTEPWVWESAKPDGASPRCETLACLASERGARRLFLLRPVKVMSNHFHHVNASVPLDPELEPALVAALREKLGR